jgi:transposase-like protein
MPVAKNKSNTTRATSSTPATNSLPNQPPDLTSPLPAQREFHLQLRLEALAVLRPFLQRIMREELDALIGCEWGEHSPARQGYRNGYYQRDLGTTNGTLKGVKVPRDREGVFHTQVFERYHRYQPLIEEGLTQMFVAGVSTDKVGQVTETLMGVKPSKSAVSRLNADLSEQFEQWRQRPLAPHWQIIYLDGVYYKVRHGEQAVSMPFLVALGVDQAGHKEILSLRGSAEESKEGWRLLLEDLRVRGVQQGGLFITDGNDGLLAALAEVFPATPRQRCLLHIQRSVASAIPKGERGKIWAELSGIWQQPTKAQAQDQLLAFKARYERAYPEAVGSLLSDEGHLFTFYQFEAKWHKFMRTTNAIESLFNNVRTRTDNLEVFTTEQSGLTILWAALQGIKLARLPI